MKNKLMWVSLGLIFALGLWGVTRLTATFDRWANPPPMPIVVEKRVNVLEIIKPVKVIPYGERLQVVSHNREGCDDYSWYNPARYAAYACSDLQGVGTVSVKYNFPNIVADDIRKDDGVNVINLGASEFILELSEKDIVPINESYGVIKSNSGALEYSSKSKVLLEKQFLTDACVRKFQEKALANINSTLSNDLYALTKQKFRFEAKISVCA